MHWSSWRLRGLPRANTAVLFPPGRPRPHLRLHALLQLRLLGGQAFQVGAGGRSGGALGSQCLLRLPAAM